MSSTLESLTRSSTSSAPAPLFTYDDTFVAKNATQFAVTRFPMSLAALVESGTGYGTVTDTSDRNFAHSLRRIQEHSGLNWSEIARTIGVSRRTVYNWLADTTVSGVNAARIAGLYRAITQELTGVRRESARPHLLAPGPGGDTPLSRITRDLREQYTGSRPVISGFDLLRTPSAIREEAPSGRLDDSIELVEIFEAEQEASQEGP